MPVAVLAAAILGIVLCGESIALSPAAAQPNVDELIKWLEDLWSQNKQLQEMFTEQEWQKFLELIQQ